ncbi:15901_t:CDS:2 [Funneliformis geosporum]|nr:15901_t:CDS:2 [Funneliformis geosporum]
MRKVINKHAGDNSQQNKENQSPHKSLNELDSRFDDMARMMESKPNTVIYENTTYIYGRQHQGTVGLYKLIGGIMALRYVFDFIQEVTSIAVNQVKPFKDKLFRGQEQIEGLTCQVGRGKG